LARWTTPLNLPVVQPYRSEGHVIKTIAHNVKTEANVDNNRVSVAKQKTAFPPNFVHSLDATHMMMTAVKCGEAGIAFAGVHDSFWTHASDVDRCRDILRTEFYELYKRPAPGELTLLEKLLAEVIESNPNMQDGRPSDWLDRLRNVPQPGDLNLEDVKQSTYFFN